MDTGTAVVLSLEVVEDALVPVDHVIVVTLSVRIVEDTSPSVDSVTSVVLSVEDVELAAASAEVVRGVVPPEGITEEEVGSVVDVTGVRVSLDIF